MRRKLTLTLLFILLCAGVVSAETYTFSGTVTLCTESCGDFPWLDVGSEVSGEWTIETTAGGTWTFADIGAWEASFLNPAVPLEPYFGDPLAANPYPVTDLVAPLWEAGGTTDGSNNLNSGTILNEFVIPPLFDNGVFISYTIGAGGQTTGRICMFYLTAGCIPGATEIAVFEGAFTRGSVAGVEETSAMLRLSGAAPNPFNPTTQIAFTGIVGERTTVQVFDSRGRVVARLFEGVATGTEQTLVWRADDLPSGVYIVMIKSGGKTETEKAVLLK